MRSAYRMLVTTEMNKENSLEKRAGHSNATNKERVWVSIWEILVPANLKVFVWRQAKKSLPTTHLLHHHNMAATMSCPLCGVHDSWHHSLMNCAMRCYVKVIADEDLIDKMIANHEPCANN